MVLPPLSARNDYVFKKVFSENPTVLRDFLSAVLDLPTDDYTQLTIVDPHLGRQYLEDKLGVLDIKITTASGKVIDVEVQVKSQRAIWKRMQFYTAKLVVEQIKSGHNFAAIKRAISILIADFVMIEENDAYHNRFRLHDENTGARYPDSMEINVLELPKIHETDGTQLGNWMQFFKATTEEDYMQAAQSNPAINDAWAVIKVLSGDERERALAEAREKARMDWESYLSDARYEGEQIGLQKGLQEGRQEGRQEGMIEVARNALRKNMTHDIVADLTGLPLDEIKRLASDLH